MRLCAWDSWLLKDRMLSCHFPSFHFSPLPPLHSPSRAPLRSLYYYYNLLKQFWAHLGQIREHGLLCEFGSPAGTADFRNISAEKASLIWFAHGFVQQVVRCPFWGSCYGFIQYWHTQPQTHPHLCLNLGWKKLYKTADGWAAVGLSEKIGDGESSVFVFLGKIPPQEVFSVF